MNAIDANGMTLSQVLALLGWKHEKHTNSSRQGRDVYQADGTHMGVLSALECWVKLREMGLIEGEDVSLLLASRL